MKVEDLKIGMKVKIEFDRSDLKGIENGDRALVELSQQGYGYVLQLCTMPYIGVNKSSNWGGSESSPLFATQLTPYEEEETKGIKVGDKVRILEGAAGRTPQHEVGGVHEVLSVGGGGVYLYPTPENNGGYFYPSCEVELVDPLDEMQELTRDEYEEEITSKHIQDLLNLGFEPRRLDDCSGGVVDWFRKELPDLLLDIQWNECTESWSIEMFDSQGGEIVLELDSLTDAIRRGALLIEALS